MFTCPYDTYFIFLFSSYLRPRIGHRAPLLRVLWTEWVAGCVPGGAPGYATWEQARWLFNFCIVPAVGAAGLLFIYLPNIYLHSYLPRQESGVLLKVSGVPWLFLYSVNHFSFRYHLSINLNIRIALTAGIEPTSTRYRSWVAWESRESFFKSRREWNFYTYFL